MEPPVCLDTDIIINFLKNESPEMEELLIQGQEIFVTSISAYELRLRKTNLEVIEKILSTLQILPFDDLSSQIAATINKDLKDKRRTIDIRDIFIAATCIRNNCTLLTKNKKHFKPIKELEIA